MKEIQCTKPFRKFYDLFYNGYDLDYCKQRGLFYIVDKLGNVRYITKTFVDYAQEVITTDFTLILNSGVIVQSQDKELEQFLVDYISTIEFQNLLDKYIMQGLVLGDTLIRFSVDNDGKPRLSVPNLNETRISYFKEGFDVVGWAIEYQTIIDEDYVNVREEYFKNGVNYYVNGELISTVPYDEDEAFWLIHVINKPSLYWDVWGSTDLENIYEAIDEINSTFARMGAIEDIYAKPKIIASGMRDFNVMKESDNVWLINDNAEIQILEYKGSILPSMLDKIKFLEEYLKSMMPELLLANLRELTGYALKLKLVKLIMKINTYRRNYFGGLKHALKLVAKHSGFENPEFDFVLSDVIPNDEFQDVNRYAQLMSMGIVSRKTVSDRLGFNYDYEQQVIQQERNNDANYMSGLIDAKLKRLDRRGAGGQTKEKKIE